MTESVSETAIAGTISPRNVDTVTYKVVSELPYANLPKPGERMAVWEQGEVFVNVNGGLRPIRNSEIDEWEKEGMIERASR